MLVRKKKEKIEKRRQNNAVLVIHFNVLLGFVLFHLILFFLRSEKKNSLEWLRYTILAHTKIIGNKDSERIPNQRKEHIGRGQGKGDRDERTVFFVFL